MISPGPLVSVVIPAFDAEATIGGAIASALAQSWADFELIVIDDGSRDRTAALVSEIAAGDARVRLVGHPRNLGPSAARNTGLAEARGRYCAFLDADDEWLPEKLARQVAAFEANPAASLVCCDALWVRDGQVEGAVYDGCRIESGPEAWKSMLEDVYVGTPCAMVVTQLARSLGGFDPALRVGEDQDLWLRLAFAGPVVALPERLVRYRRRPGSYMDRHRDLSITDWLPRLEAHVAAHRRQLTRVEHRRILRRIYERMGRNACRDGRWAIGLRLLALALWHGAPPQGVAFTLASMLLPLGKLRRLLSRSRGDAATIGDP